MKIGVKIIVALGLLLSMGGGTAAAKCQKKSEKAVTELSARERQFTYVWYMAREAYVKREYGKAGALYFFCEQLCPEDAHTKNSLGRLYGKLGYEAREKGDSKTAEEMDGLMMAYLEKAYRLDTAYWGDYMTVLGKQERWEELKKEAGTLAKKYPKNGVYWYQYAYGAHSVKDYKTALEALKQREKCIGGIDRVGVEMVVDIYGRERQWKKALEVLDRYTEAYAQDVEMMGMKVQLMEYLGANIADLARVYEEILQYDGENLMVMNNYAYLLATNGGDLNKAERLSQRTIQEQPTNPTFLDTYAWILYLKKEYVLAQYYIRQAKSYSKIESEEINEHYRIIMQTK